MIEIGSEFHWPEKECSGGIVFPSMIEDYVLTFSGRTAIETVLKNEPNISKVAMPSFCCDSMIEPFRQLDIKITFYDVYYDNGLKIDFIIDDDVDCVLWNNYFGFEIQMPDFSSLINKGVVIIEDITHSFYSKIQYDKQSKYLVASIRKWEPIICGGYCASTKNKLQNKPIEIPSTKFCLEKKKAMLDKKMYLDGNTSISKDDYLNAFKKSNNWLRDNYSGLKIDNESMEILTSADFENNKYIRRRNAEILYSQISNNCIKFLFDKEKMDCPLFIPVILEPSVRYEIMNELIANKIFCPIHWPHPKADCASNLYDTELSLICDQRYSEKDMLRIASVINNYKKR